MIKNLSIQKTAFAASMALALISAQAQTADGTVVISGQINANTCKLNIADNGGVASPSTGTRSIELGTVAPPTGTAAANVPFGTQQAINFTLKNAAGTTDCLTGSAVWNIVLDLQPDQVGTAGGNSFLKNSQAAATAATNVGVALFQSGGVRLTTLATAAGYNGTKVSTANAGASGGLSLVAQFVTTSAASNPTAGLFTATVPLLVVYQ